MTIILNRHIADRPAVHALIIAVGNYPYLLDGALTTFARHEGMGQLSSPPIAASRIADWLRTDFSPYESALATIDVYCSGQQLFFAEDSENSITVANATFANVKNAVRDWKMRGDENEENTLIFYFCGHGVTSGTIDSLLLEGFGSDPDTPFEADAINVANMINGMRSCKALKQLFLLDACRTAPEGYLLDFNDDRGSGFISLAKHKNLARSKQVCIWASELGKFAYGQQGAPTIFSEAFLAAMRGAAARRDDETFDWVIEASALSEGINTYIKRSVAGANTQFATPGTMTRGFPLHVLAGPPIVPVSVVCKPKSKSQDLDLTCHPSALTVRGLNGPWHIELQCGKYQVTATETISGNLLATEECMATPPGALVPITLEP